MGRLGLFTGLRIAIDIPATELVALAQSKSRRRTVMEILLILIFAVPILWLGAKILEKAGIRKEWVFCLLIPIVNIIMIWVFAFAKWPNLKPGVKQDL